MKLALHPRTFGPSLMLTAGQIYTLRCLATGIAFGGFALGANPRLFSIVSATGTFFMGGFLIGLLVYFADFRIRRAGPTRARVGPLSLPTLLAFGVVAGGLFLASIWSNLAAGRPWVMIADLTACAFGTASLQGVSRFLAFRDP